MKVQCPSCTRLAHLVWKGVCGKGHRILAAKPHPECGFPQEYDIDSAGIVQVRCICNAPVKWERNHD